MTRARRTHTDFRCCRTKTFTIGVLLRLSTQTPLTIANVGVNTFSDNRPAAVSPRERLQLLTYRCRSLIQQHTRIYKALRREVSRHCTESMCLRARESFVTATRLPLPTPHRRDTFRQFRKQLGSRAPTHTYRGPQCDDHTSASHHHLFLSSTSSTSDQWRQPQTWATTLAATSFGQSSYEGFRARPAAA